MIIKRTQQKRFPVFCLVCCLTCCLTCLFCFIGSISAFALQTATPSDADKIRIIKIQNEDELLALPDFTLPLKIHDFLFSHISTRILFFYHFKQSATSIGVMHRMGVAHSYLAPILHKMQISHFSAKAQ